MSTTIAPAPTRERGPASGRRQRSSPGDTFRAAAAVAAGATLALGVCVLYFVAAAPPDLEDGRTAVGLFVAGMAGLALAGAAVVRQTPASRIGWLLLGTALVGTASRFSVGLAVDAELAGAGWAAAAGWVTNWSWVPAQALALLLFLRFPDGDLPSPRWRWVEHLVLGWSGLTLLATALVPGELGLEPLSGRTNPVGVDALDGVLDAVLGVLFTAAPLLALLAVVGPVARWRRAGPRERRQLGTVGVSLLLIVGAAPIALVSDTGEVLEGVAYLALSGTIAWAVLRQRLWDLELRGRLDRLHAVRDEERLRLQRELHDTLGPLLGSIGMRAEAALNLLAQGAPGRVADVLRDIDRDTEDAVLEVRRMLDDLGPSALAEADLATAVRALLDGHAGAGPRFRLAVPLRPPELDPAREVVAFRVVAEAVRNVVRHAGARTCRVEVAVDGDDLRVEVADDGVGLRGQAPGVGRRSMGDRVAEVGGTLEVADREQGGVVVRAELPGAVR